MFAVLSPKQTLLTFSSWRYFTCDNIELSSRNDIGFLVKFVPRCPQTVGGTVTSCVHDPPFRLEVEAGISLPREVAGLQVALPATL